MKFRKITAVLSALTLLTGSLTGLSVSAAAKGSGDVDANGRVAIADAILLARYIAEDKDITVTAQGRANADMNGDDQINSDDSSELLAWLAGSEAPQKSAGRSVDLLAGLTAGEAAAVQPDAAFCKAQADFSAALFRKTVADEEDPDKNVLISPLSVSLALGMTMNGAKGVTLDEMQKVLGGELTAEQLNAYYAGWSEALEQEKEIVYYNPTDPEGFGEWEEIREMSKPVSIADAVWIKDDPQMIQVPGKFLQTLFDYYRAGAYKAPFDNSTVDDINSWVSDKTHKMIPKLLEKDSLTDDHVMVLVNALTFESLWLSPYEQWNVGTRTFHAADGSEREVEMMFGEYGSYLDDGKATGFVNPYKDDRYCFAAVMPNEGITLDEYIAGLDGDALTKLLQSTKSHDVIGGLPKFSFSYSTRMKQTLKALGMPTAFGDGKESADFSGLNSVPNADTYIDEVLHKTFIDVSESGTKAAAVTAVMMANGSAVMDPPIRITLDRPFLFMIVDKQTNLPIFLGAVKDIQAEQ